MPTAIDFVNRRLRTPRASLPLRPPTIPITFATIDVDGVFQGGGALGAAYLGSLTLMTQAGLWFSRVAGNSAGAITASMVAAGYSAAEIEWLMSNFTNKRLARPTTLPSALTDPIDFMEFLDFPELRDITPAGKQATLLWQVLKGQALDEILETELPIPTQADTVNAIVSALKSLPAIGATINGLTEPSLRTTLNVVLAPLPNRKPQLKDFTFFDETENLRTLFANAVWDAVATARPDLLISTQFLYEGSVFQGRKFFEIMEKLLRARVPGGTGRNGTVVFRDLKIPLAVIGCDYSVPEMEVYSSRTTPAMSVAEAVRRSMSIPLMFEPRGRDKTIIDGGACSNFPLWLLTPGADQYWPTISIDHSRPKVGFSLDQTKEADSAWNVEPAKFDLVGTPPRVEQMDVLVTVMISKLKEMGLFVPTPALSDAGFKIELRKWKALEVIFGYLSVDKEKAARKQVSMALMSGMRYFDIEIPLLGFDWLDFKINSDRDDLDAIASRGYMSARSALSAAPVNGTALIGNTSNLINPY